MLSDYESGSPPSRDENSITFPCLQKRINTKFANLKLEPATQRHGSFDFGSHYRQLYWTENQQRETHVRHPSDTVNWIMNQASLRNESPKSYSCERLHTSDISGDRTVLTNSNNKLVLNGVCNGDCAGESVLPSIWCIDYIDNLIVIGCSNGRIEFWEGTTGKFKVNFLFNSTRFVKFRLSTTQYAHICTY